MCPAQPPVAEAGIPYEADFTFWMPASFSDPGSGVTVNFQQMTVTDVSGLPIGLDMQTNDPAGVYFPQQDEFGCARICGTPLIAGLYNVVVSILATVELGGFTTQVPEEFILLLNVLPGAGGNTSFSFDPTSGCGSVTANFQALIDGDPSPTSYDWDFGNGNTSDAAVPPAQIYADPGEYVISLTTTIGGLVLNTVTITGVNDNWCGDVEEPNVPLLGCTGSPDLYFVLTDANGTSYNSSTFDDTFSATWSGIGLVLGNPPYSLAIYDEDPISQDDHLGTYNIPANGVGTYYINVAGGTTGSLEISLETQQVFTDMDTIIVHPQPLVEIEQQGAQLCAADTSLIGHIWLLNGDTLPQNDPCIVAVAGSYQLIAFNGFGCQNISETFIICPELEIIQTENVLSVPSGYSNYSWSLNDGPIAGANNSFIIIQQAGNYSVTVDAGNNCIVTATMSLVTGLEEIASETGRVHVFPNPSNGSFTVTANGLSGSTARLELLDALGKLVQARQQHIVDHKLKVAILAQTDPGLYYLRITDDRTSFTRQLVIQ